MTLVITMAGLGSRFYKAGYTVPKYQIEVNGHTLFHWSLRSLTGISSKKYVFVVRKEDNSTKFIEKECMFFNIVPNIVEIDYLTSGQAETAILAAPYCVENEPFFIYNIDTYIEEGIMNDKDMKGDGFIPCFSGKGDHWSFVKTDEQGFAIEVREKKRISDFCTVGAYYFSTFSLYKKLYAEYYLKNSTMDLEAGERYIAPLYNYFIQKYNGKVCISNISTETVHVLGTPEEVEIFKKKVLE